MNDGVVVVNVVDVDDGAVVVNVVDVDADAVVVIVTAVVVDFYVDVDDDVAVVAAVTTTTTTTLCTIHSQWVFKKGGGVPFFQCRATVTKVGTKIAETLPDAPIESNFPKKCYFMPKIVNFLKKAKFSKNDFFGFVQPLWLANVDQFQWFAHRWKAATLLFPTASIGAVCHQGFSP